ncbi:MAG: SMP-30/gluconolactonase/LRE family protein [Balneolaceae bacterium]|nr:SMP-30/gluconolactonase/LRE family protein [Balneolaceae bacterium]
MSVQTFEAKLELEADAHLGEGPVWDAKTQKLFWVDILSGKLFKYDPESGRNSSFNIGEHVGAAVLRKKGGLVLALQSGFAFFDPENEKLERFADPESHLPGNRFNDGKCDPAGRFWAGTLAYDLKKGAGSLYCLHPDMSVNQKVTGVTISNGLAWNRNEDTFYFIDTPTRQISAFDYERETGNIKNRRVIRELPEEFGYPDGMANDEEGYLWIAFYAGSKVRRFNPENGELVAEINVPVPKPTSCAFGGENLDELYITTCREHMSREEVEQHPLSGSIFKVKLPVKGVPVNSFAG